MDIPELTNDEIKCLQEILNSYNICDFCIGRIFSTQNSTSLHKKNGSTIRENYTTSKPKKSIDCQLCDGIINDIKDYIILIHKALENYEFSSFLIGFHVDISLLKHENDVFVQFNARTSDPIKLFLKRTIGLYLEKKWKKSVLFDNADIMIIVNTMFNSVDLQIKSLYVYGRYNKYKRGIPQSKWFCRSCRGIGCRMCQYTGTLYETSVEQSIAKPFLEYTQGTDDRFHGSGREDIDVRMLGDGRPFIIEIINPKKRHLNLNKITEKINKQNKEKISVSNLCYTTKENIKRIKQSKYAKIYEISFEAEKPFDIENLKKVALTLQGTIIKQYTPTRVARRRANKIRQRQVYECRVVSVKKNRACFQIESESGTYIKELVTGDNGKTKPNISDLIGQNCKVLTLDVMEIKGD